MPFFFINGIVDFVVWKNGFVNKVVDVLGTVLRKVKLWMKL